MRILIITQLYPQPDDVGDNKPTKTVEYFAKEWVKEGHKVIVAHCPSKFPFVFYLIPPAIKNKLAGATSNIFPSLSSRRKLRRKEFGIIVYRFPMLKLFPGNGYSSRRMYNQANEIKKYLKKEHFVPDLVVGHFANPSAELTAILSKAYNSKSSIVFHHDCTRQNIEKYRINKSIKHINAIGVRSVIEAHQVKKRLNLPKLPFICYSGVPNDAVEAAASICQKHDFSNGIKHLYVGSLIKRKHLDSVIKAFLNTSDENDSLTVVGGGPEEKTLKKLVSDLNGDTKIIFTGRIPREKVLEEMKNSQIFTLISSGETFGMVYVEAMLQGCLTIASKGEGFDGIIKDGLNGFLCNAGDQNNLEKIYARIKNMSKDERNTIGQAALDLAMHFSEREVAENYLNDILMNQR